MTEHAIIAPEGELDIYGARALAPGLNAAAGAHYPLVVLDLSGVTFVDSTSLATILQAHQRLERQGRALVLVVPPGSAAAVVLDLSGLGARLSVVASRDDALGAR
jgi:anti-anti-sigma factor